MWHLRHRGRPEGGLLEELEFYSGSASLEPEEWTQVVPLLDR